MRLRSIFVIITLFVLATASGRAAAGDPVDYAELRDGTVLEGKYMGGTAETVRFETAQGLRVISRRDLLAITFAEPAAAPATAAPPVPAPSPAPAPASAPAAVTSSSAYAGTLVLVKMTSTVSSRDAAGKRFSATLETDLLSDDGKVLAKAGTTVYGRVEASKKAGRLAGKSSLALALTEINIDGRAVPIATTDYAEAGQGSFKKTARNAAVGAAIGGAFGGSKGAGQGAAIGAGTAVLRRGEAVTVPAGALLEFRLTEALTLAPAR